MGNWKIENTIRKKVPLVGFCKGMVQDVSGNETGGLSGEQMEGELFGCPETLGANQDMNEEKQRRKTSPLNFKAEEKDAEMIHPLKILEWKPKILIAFLVLPYTIRKEV